MKTSLLILFCAFILIAENTYSQTVNNLPGSGGKNNSPVPPASKDRERPYFSGLYNYDRPWAEKPLKIEKEQKEKYRDFLKQKGTGIFKLIPLTAQANQESFRKDRPVAWEAAHFWFRKEVHFSEFADIVIKKDTFATGIAFRSIGSIIPLGNVPLEAIDFNLPEAKQLEKITLPKNAIDILAASTKTRKSTAVALNRTYVLRSVIYERSIAIGEHRLAFYTQGISDSLLAFRVVEIAPDGSVLILWKALRPFKTPSLKNNIS